MAPQLGKLAGVTAVEGGRWVEDGNLVTAAGVSAGIDMALYLVGQLISPAAARAIQRYMEYEPAPPYQDVAPLPPPGFEAAVPAG